MGARGAGGDRGASGGGGVLLPAGSARAQCNTQLARLLGTGGVGANQIFGFSVSLSGDGNTAVVGAPLDSFNIGAAYIFVRSGTTWTQQGPKLVPTGGVGSGQFGYSVSLSGDGNTAVVGAPIDNGNIGAAYVFVRSGGVWTQQGPKLIPTGGVGAGNFGVSISLSADGNTAVVGAPFDNNSIGAAYAFERLGTTWTQPRPKLIPTGGVGGIQTFGYSVSLSANGNTAVVGAYTDNGFIGAVYVFVVNTTIAFTQQPADAAVSSGATATFMVAASSPAPLTYQWRRSGVNLANGPTGTGSVISGAATPTLAISLTTPADNGGAFDCVVTNACGPARSDPAGLAVTPSCLADFHRDGAVNSQDFFDFLTAFFAGCP